MIITALKNQARAEQKPQRQSGVELLRIVLMVMVVMLHYNGYLGHAMEFCPQNSAAWFYTHFLEALGVCAVDCFVLISGYFLAHNKKIQLKRILVIMLTVMLVYETGYLINVIFGNADFSFKRVVASMFPANYYAFLYLTTYILSPFLNLIFDRLKTKKNCGAFTALLLGLFIVYPTFADLFCDILKHFNKKIDIIGGISTITAKGNLQGYTIVNFVTIYCLGVFTRRFELKLSKAKSLACYFASCALIFAGMTIAYEVSFSYCSIFCVASAWFLFLFFLQLDFCSKIVNAISKATFGVFCLHASLSFLFFPESKIQSVCSEGKFAQVFFNSFLCVGAMTLACYALVVFLLSIYPPPFVVCFTEQNCSSWNGLSLKMNKCGIWQKRKNGFSFNQNVCLATKAFG